MRLPGDCRCGPTWSDIDHHRQPAAEPVAEALLQAGSGLLGLGTPRQRAAGSSVASCRGSLLRGVDSRRWCLDLTRPPLLPAAFASNVQLIGGDENNRTLRANGMPSMEMNCIAAHTPTKCDNS